MDHSTRDMGEHLLHHAQPTPRSRLNARADTNPIMSKKRDDTRGMAMITRNPTLIHEIENHRRSGRTEIQHLSHQFHADRESETMHGTHRRKGKKGVRRIEIHPQPHPHEDQNPKE
jgi:hypothetical protein